ncbi:probable protein kinase [Cephalotrichum gorgonifer]|uniref:Probable protein kinase n=1 Tax=Cephalotrichum gorgonifer TaxID=2041049 RepID=A0AAE8SQU2_9PEZI|nr:probable protein kinase [Cephalotrichum gorgonifer]
MSSGRAIPAQTTVVRGFTLYPAKAGDESDCTDSSNTCDARCETPPPLRNRRGRCLDDVVSANCSPVMKGIPSPSVSGIAKLRQATDSGLDISSRTSTMTLSGSQPCLARASGGGDVSGLSSVPMSRTGSRDTVQSDFTSTGSDSGSTSYEVKLESEFVSDSMRDKHGGAMFGAVEGGLVSRGKMTAQDFEPLRCLGKGTFGTVILVKQRTTGRLYAQKQFKKASLVLHKKLVEQTKTERQVLESVNRHPFVVKLFYAFQDQEKLYLILEYGQGGELFTHLNAEKMFPEPVAAFYMAEMLLAISHLHTDLGVVYRDLKPENCLLDADGHLLLTDFGLSKVSAEDADSCNSMLGTVEYMAPEVVKGAKYGRAVDWWSFGALGYDLLTGNPPFRGGNNAKIQENILKQKLALPYFMSADAKDLITRLLRKDPSKRLGANMPQDLAAMKKHRFFRKIDWKKLLAREMTPPIQPFITDPELAENFDASFTELALSPVVRTRESFGGRATRADDNRDDPFGGFSFVAPSSLLAGF